MARARSSFEPRSIEILVIFMLTLCRIKYKITAFFPNINETAVPTINKISLVSITTTFLHNARHLSIELGRLISQNIGTCVYACALVNSRLDYSNLVLYGTSKTNLARLQRVQNSLARVVVTARRTDSIKPILERLHWLPIDCRIKYKVATLAYKVRETGYPAYLRSAVVELLPNRTSRSSDKLF